jgi:ferredoxin
MGHQIYIDEELKPLDFNEADDLNILDFIEGKGIEMHSHCRAGFCGTCRVSLIRGDVHYPGGLPLGYIREGEILPCCCVPTTDIEIRTS